MPFKYDRELHVLTLQTFCNIVHFNCSITLAKQDLESFVFQYVTFNYFITAYLMQSNILSLDPFVYCIFLL